MMAGWKEQHKLNDLGGYDLEDRGSIPGKGVWLYLSTTTMGYTQCPKGTEE
jgi:hypothetical protein